MKIYFGWRGKVQYGLWIVFVWPLIFALEVGSCVIETAKRLKSLVVNRS